MVLKQAPANWKEAHTQTHRQKNFSFVGLILLDGTKFLRENKIIIIITESCDFSELYVLRYGFNMMDVLLKWGSRAGDSVLIL